MTVSPQPQLTTVQANSGYASLMQSSSAPSRPNSTKPAPKPINVFSNDGSFLERFQRARNEEKDKMREQEAAERKKAFNDRFKSRGKRKAITHNMDESKSPSPASSSIASTRTSPAANTEESPIKRQKVVQNGQLATSGRRDSS